jgi:hypothetical protein
LFPKGSDVNTVERTKGSPFELVWRDKHKHQKHQMTEQILSVLHSFKKMVGLNSPDTNGTQVAIMLHTLQLLTPPHEPAY